MWRGVLLRLHGKEKGMGNKSFWKALLGVVTAKNSKLNMSLMFNRALSHCVLRLISKTSMI